MDRSLSLLEVEAQLLKLQRNQPTMMLQQTQGFSDDLTGVDA
jgi:hypothetical protein